MKQTLILLLSFFILDQSLAQSTGTLKTAPAQITLITPLGTNGNNSLKTINYFSLNIIGGYHAGLNGAEFGGCINMNRDYMAGFQFAGIANYTGADATGVQFSGIINLNLGKASIFQFAGILNANIGSTQGVQAAGIANYTMGDSKVIQLGGIGNYAETISGGQIGGITNFNLKKINGTQLAGIANFSQNIEGVQVAGILNVTEYLKGVQVAGIVNMAKNVDGVQIGVLNIADTIKSGTPIGIVSFVRNGFREFEVGISEGLNTYASFKIGVDKFYNIFSIGTQYLGDFRWGVGYGLGTHLVNENDLKVNLEAMSYHINEGSEWTDAYNGLQQLKLTFAGGKNEKIKLFAGPSLNLMISKYKKKNGSIGSDFPPYHFYRDKGNKTDLKFWAGFTAGIKIQ